VWGNEAPGGDHFEHWGRHVEHWGRHVLRVEQRHERQHNDQRYRGLEFFQRSIQRDGIFERG
jgi:hypothetical protein